MRVVSLLVAGSLAVSGCGKKQAHYLGAASLSPSLLDLQGETLGALGSGIFFDSKSGNHYFIPDRGPGDGSMDFRPRFQVAQVDFREKVLGWKLLQTTLLRAPDGQPMSGLIPDLPASAEPRLRDGRWCLDSEAIALAPDGSVYLSDEYGPFLYQFSPDGLMLRYLRPPDYYLPKTKLGEINYGDAAEIVRGRLPNRGFEGMALSPDGQRAFLILQSGLVQDGGKDSRFTRILVLDLASGQPIAEYAYPFADLTAINQQQSKHHRLKQDDLSVSELIPIDEHRFLVLERDNRGADGSTEPKQPVHKNVYVIDLAGATNLLGTAGSLELVKSLVPVQKSLLVDLLSAAAPGNLFTPDQLAAKWEGLALSAPDSHGNRRLLVACDNDFLNPELQLAGRKIPFPRAKRPLSTQFLLFEVNLPLRHEFRND